MLESSVCGATELLDLQPIKLLNSDCDIRIWCCRCFQDPVVNVFLSVPCVLHF